MWSVRRKQYGGVRPTYSTGSMSCTENSHHVNCTEMLSTHTSPCMEGHRAQACFKLFQTWRYSLLYFNRVQQQCTLSKSPQRWVVPCHSDSISLKKKVTQLSTHLVIHLFFCSVWLNGPLVLHDSKGNLHWKLLKGLDLQRDFFLHKCKIHWVVESSFPLYSGKYLKDFTRGTPSSWWTISCTPLPKSSNT